ncbi:hypothetical protein [Undibacterium sp. TS12]|nr:hypothetical protein [Undibacterium sp. TS12]MCH8620368.1 hypothetical protein [Undibacterium sp. TS12]
MKIQGSVALVTGANRGLGSASAQGLLAACAVRVHASLSAESPVYLGTGR